VRESTSAGAVSESAGCGIMAHDLTFLLGDLNYRIEGARADIQSLVAAGDWATLQSRDQVPRSTVHSATVRCRSPMAAAAGDAQAARRLPTF
jgi:hypothetical protein